MERYYILGFEYAFYLARIERIVFQAPRLEAMIYEFKQRVHLNKRNPGNVV